MPIYAKGGASIKHPLHLIQESDMGGQVDHLDSKDFVPFKKRRNAYKLPVLTKRAEEQVIDEVDPDLRPEEQGFVRHYLAYADVMLKNSESVENSGEAQAEAEKENSGEAQPEEKALQPGREEAPLQETSAREGKQKSNLTEMPKPEAEDSHAA
jgi:hypothetical protein